MAMSDVIVIGAGPFGLSISAHLRNRGVEHTIVGKPMDTWRNSYAARTVSKVGTLRIGDFCRDAGL